MDAINQQTHYKGGHKRIQKYLKINLNQSNNIYPKNLRVDAHENHWSRSRSSELRK